MEVAASRLHVVATHANAVTIIKGEIHRVASSMRGSHASPERFVRELPAAAESPLLRAFKVLYDELQAYEDLDAVDAVMYLQPFLDVISEPATSALITASALAAVNKFCLYGFLTLDAPRAGEAVNRTAAAAARCRFEPSPPATAGDDEATQMRLLELLGNVVRCGAGERLSDEAVWETVQCAYLLSKPERGSSRALQRRAEAALSDVVLHVFSRVADVVAAGRDRVDGSTLLYDPEGGQQAVAVRQTPASSSARHRQQHAPPYGAPVLTRLLQWLSGLVDPKTNARGTRLLALELISTVLETGGTALGSLPTLVTVAQAELCRFLIASSRTSDLTVLRAALRVVRNLFISLKTHLKVQLEVFMTSVLLYLADGCPEPPPHRVAPASAAARAAAALLRGRDEHEVYRKFNLRAEQAELALESLGELSRESDLLPELYANYDCDENASNVAEMMVRCLARNAAPADAQAPSTATVPVARFTALHSLALEGLLAIIRNLSRRAAAAVALQELVAAERSAWQSSAIDGVEPGDEALAIARHMSPLPPSTYNVNVDAVVDSIAVDAAPTPVLERLARGEVVSMRRMQLGDEVNDSTELPQHGATGGTTSTPRATLSLIDDRVAQPHAAGRLHQPAARVPVQQAGSELAELSRDRAAAVLRARKQLKGRYALAAARFNSQKGWIEYAQELALLPTPATPSDIAYFLRNVPGLDRALIGIYLSEPDDEKHAFNTAVRAAYVETFNVDPRLLGTGSGFLDVLRSFLESFRLPGEAQKIERLMASFAGRVWAAVEAGDSSGGGGGDASQSTAGSTRQSGHPFTHADTPFVLAYSVVMLNTDLHNRTVKRKMTKEAFISNNRGIDNGADLPAAFLGEIYDSIGAREIQLRADAVSSTSSSRPHGSGSSGAVGASKGSSSGDTAAQVSPSQAGSGARGGSGTTNNHAQGNAAEGEGAAVAAAIGSHWDGVLRRQQTVRAYAAAAPSGSSRRAGAAGHERDLFLLVAEPCLRALCAAMDATTDPLVLRRAATGLKQLADLAAVYAAPRLLDAVIVAVGGATLRDLESLYSGTIAEDGEAIAAARRVARRYAAAYAGVPLHGAAAGEEGAKDDEAAANGSPRQVNEGRSLRGALEVHAAEAADDAGSRDDHRRRHHQHRRGGHRRRRHRHHAKHSAASSQQPNATVRDARGAARSDAEVETSVESGGEDTDDDNDIDYFSYAPLEANRDERSEASDMPRSTVDENDAMQADPGSATLSVWSLLLRRTTLRLTTVLSLASTHACHMTDPKGAWGTVIAIWLTLVTVDALPPSSTASLDDFRAPNGARLPSAADVPRMSAAEEYPLSPNPALSQASDPISVIPRVLGGSSTLARMVADPDATVLPMSAAAAATGAGSVGPLTHLQRLFGGESAGGAADADAAAYTWAMDSVGAAVASAAARGGGLESLLGVECAHLPPASLIALLSALEHARVAPLATLLGDDSDGDNARADSNFNDDDVHRLQAAAARLVLLTEIVTAVGLRNAWRLRRAGDESGRELWASLLRHFMAYITAINVLPQEQQQEKAGYLNMVSRARGYVLERAVVGVLRIAVRCFSAEKVELDAATADAAAAALRVAQAQLLYGDADTVDDVGAVQSNVADIAVARSGAMQHLVHAIGGNAGSERRPAVAAPVAAATVLLQLLLQCLRPEALAIAAPRLAAGVGLLLRLGPTVASATTTAKRGSPGDDNDDDGAFDFSLTPPFFDACLDALSASLASSFYAAPAAWDALCALASSAPSAALYADLEAAVSSINGVDNTTVAAALHLHSTVVSRTAALAAVLVSLNAADTLVAGVAAAILLAEEDDVRSPSPAGAGQEQIVSTVGAGDAACASPVRRLGSSAGFHAEASAAAMTPLQRRASQPRTSSPVHVGSPQSVLKSGRRTTLGGYRSVRGRGGAAASPPPPARHRASNGLAVVSSTPSHFGDGSASAPFDVALAAHVVNAPLADLREFTGQAGLRLLEQLVDGLLQLQVEVNPEVAGSENGVDPAVAAAVDACWLSVVTAVSSLVVQLSRPLNALLEPLSELAPAKARAQVFSQASDYGIGGDDDGISASLPTVIHGHYLLRSLSIDELGPVARVQPVLLRTACALLTRLLLASPRVTLRLSRAQGDASGAATCSSHAPEADLQPSVSYVAEADLQQQSTYGSPVARRSMQLQHGQATPPPSAAQRGPLWLQLFLAGRSSTAPLPLKPEAWSTAFRSAVLPAVRNTMVLLKGRCTLESVEPIVALTGTTARALLSASSALVTSRPTDFAALWLGTLRLLLQLLHATAPAADATAAHVGGVGARVNTAGPVGGESTAALAAAYDAAHECTLNVLMVMWGDGTLELVERLAGSGDNLVHVGTGVPHGTPALTLRSTTLQLIDATFPRLRGEIAAVVDPATYAIAQAAQAESATISGGNASGGAHSAHTPPVNIATTASVHVGADPGSTAAGMTVRAIADAAAASPARDEQNAIAPPTTGFFAGLFRAIVGEEDESIIR